MIINLVRGIQLVAFVATITQ